MKAFIKNFGKPIAMLCAVTIALNSFLINFMAQDGPFDGSPSLLFKPQLLNVGNSGSLSGSYANAPGDNSTRNNHIGTSANIPEGNNEENEKETVASSGNDDNGETKGLSAYTVLSFAELEEYVREQPFVVNSDKRPFLPESLVATVHDGESEYETEIEGIGWDSEPEFNIASEGVYMHTAVLPEGYETAGGAVLPIIRVEVVPPVTGISLLAGENADNPIFLTQANFVSTVSGFTSANTWGKYYELSGNITLSSWTPVAFSGHLDGAGHTISGLTVNSNTAAGLFSTIVTYDGGVNMTPASITNLGVVLGGDINGGSNPAGGIVGYIPEAWGQVTIQNCYVTGVATIYGSEAGGIVGSIQQPADDPIISNCYATVTVDGEDSAGGIVGMNGGADISNNAALNDIITGSSAGRVIGNTGGTNNIAFDGMSVNGNININGSADDENGEDLLLDGPGTDDIAGYLENDGGGAKLSARFSDMTRAKDSLPYHSIEVTDAQAPHLFPAPVTFATGTETPMSFGPVALGYNTVAAKSFTVGIYGGTKGATDVKAVFAKDTDANPAESSPFAFVGYSAGATFSLIPGGDNTETISVQPKTGLGVGTHSDVIIITWTGGSLELEVNFTVNAPVITISPTGTQTFDSLTYGYAGNARGEITVRVTNSSAENGGASLTGVDFYWQMGADSPFEATSTGSSTITSGGYNEITVKPKTGRNTGDYTDTLTITATGAEPKKITFSFKVTPPVITVDTTSTQSFSAQYGYDASLPTTRTITIRNTANGGASLTGVDFYWQMGADSPFEATSTGPITITGGSSAPVSFRPKAGLGAGTHTDTLKITCTGNTTGVSIPFSFTVDPLPVVWTTGTVNDKPYDGNTSTTVSTKPSVDNIVSDDGYTLVEGLAVFNNAEVGENKPVTGSGWGITGGDSANYVVNVQPTFAAADITRAPITAVTITGIDEPSVGNTVPNPSFTFTVDNTVNGEEVAGTGTITGWEHSGSGDSAPPFNSEQIYKAIVKIKELPPANDVRYAFIAGKTVEVTLIDSGGEHTYDDITVNNSDGFAFEFVHTFPKVGYNIGDANVTYPGDNSFVYDGTAKEPWNLDFFSVSDEINGELQEGESEDYVLRQPLPVAIDIGTYEFYLDGRGAYNGTSKKLTFTITAKPIQWNQGHINDKEYDGTVAAGFSTPGIIGIADRDEGFVKISAGSVAFSTKNAADAEPEWSGWGLVDVNGATPRAHNYYFDNEPFDKTARINPKTLNPANVEISFIGKTYDGELDANVTVALSDLVEGDGVSIEAVAAAFGNKDAGTGKAVTVTGLRLAGDGANAHANYDTDWFSAFTRIGAADISQKNISLGSVTVTSELESGRYGKIYDGTDELPFNSLEFELNGVVAGVEDDVSVVYANSGEYATFTSGKDVAYKADGTTPAEKEVALPELKLGGSESGNYTLGNPANHKVEATIEPLPITLAVAEYGGKVYDGGRSADVELSIPAGAIFTGDAVTLSAASHTAEFSDGNAGNGKTVSVTLSDSPLEGDDAGNYKANPIGTLTADITRLPIQIVIEKPAEKIFDNGPAAVATSGAVSFSSSGLTGGLTPEENDYTVSVVFTGDDYSAGGSKPYSYTVTLGTTTDAKNFALVSNAVDGNDGVIHKANVEVPVPEIIYLTQNFATTGYLDLWGEDAMPSIRESLFDLFELHIDADELFNASDDISRTVVDGGALRTANEDAFELIGDKLHYYGNNNASGKDVLTVKLETKNYKYINLILTFEATDREPVDVTVVVDVDDYNGSPWSYDITWEAPDDPTAQTVSFSGALSDGNNTPYSSANPPIDPGNYTITANLSSEGYIGRGTADFTIRPKELASWGTGMVITKDYDATTAAEIETQPFNDGDIISGDEVFADGSPKFDSADVGTRGILTGEPGDWSLSGQDAWKYNLTSQTPPVFERGVIKQKSIADGIDFSGDFTFAFTESEIVYDGGEPLTPGIELIFTVPNPDYELNEDSDYNLEYVNNTDAGTATVTVSGIGNFTGSVERPFTIKKQTFTPDGIEISVAQGRIATVNVNLSGYITLTDGASLDTTPEITQPALVSGARLLAGNELEITVAAGAPGDTGEITVKVTGGVNYEDYDLIIKVTAVSASATLSGDVSGYVGLGPVENEIVVELSIGAFLDFEEFTGTGASEIWITNLPDGLTQKVEKQSDTTALITVTGVPEETAAGGITVMIPAAAVSGLSTPLPTMSVGASAEYNIVYPTYKLATAGTLDGTFGELAYGYQSSGELTFTIKNTGNQPVDGITAQIAPGGDTFEITGLSDTRLEPGATLEVKVKSKLGLGAGTYTGKLNIIWTAGEDREASLSQPLLQVVSKLEYVRPAVSIEVPSHISFTGAYSLPVLPGGLTYDNVAATELNDYLSYSITDGILSYSSIPWAVGQQADLFIFANLNSNTDYEFYRVPITFNWRTITDDDMLEEDFKELDALTFETIRLRNTGEQEIRSELDLILKGRVYESDITWTSSNMSVIAADGTVTRPAEGRPAAEVTLTATLTRPGTNETRTVTIELKVLPYIVRRGDLWGHVVYASPDGGPLYNSPIQNATVILKKAEQIVFSTLSAADGYYYFTGVPYGVYSVEIRPGSGRVITYSVEIISPENYKDFPLPDDRINNQHKNTEVNVNVEGEGAPPVAASNLEEIIEEEDFASEAVLVTVSLTVNKVEETVVPQTDKEQVEQKLEDMGLWGYLDMTLLKTRTFSDASEQREPVSEPDAPIKITLDIPEDIQNMGPYGVICVHNGEGTVLEDVVYNETTQTITFYAGKFSIYAITFTPQSSSSEPDPDDADGGNDDSDEGGRDEGGVVVGPVSGGGGVVWIERTHARQGYSNAREQGLSYMRSRGQGLIGIRKDALHELEGLIYQHDTVVVSELEVRLYIEHPETATKDILVTGRTSGERVKSTQGLFESWYGKDVRVVSLAQQGDFGTEVWIAAKIDFAAMNLDDLHFYSYDRASNSWKRFESPYKFDGKGYIYFRTSLAGDVIISAGDLKYADPVPQDGFQNPVTGGEGLPPMPVEATGDVPVAPAIQNTSGLTAEPAGTEPQEAAAAVYGTFAEGRPFAIVGPSGVSPVSGISGVSGLLDVTLMLIMNVSAIMAIVVIYMVLRKRK